MLTDVGTFRSIRATMSTTCVRAEGEGEDGRMRGM